MKQLPKVQRVAVIKCLVEGCSIRSTTRITGVSKNTIQKLSADLGEARLDLQDNALRHLKCTRIECDEIWNFCYAKDKNLPDGMKGQPDDPRHHSKSMEGCVKPQQSRDVPPNSKISLTRLIQLL